MSYIVFEDVEQFLDLTLNSDGQALVTTLAAAISQFVDDYCNRTWTINNTTDIVEIYDGGSDTYFPRNTPILSITSVVDNSYTIPANQIYNYGSHIKLGYITTYIPRSVVITYRTSANAIPVDLKHAITRWVADIFKSQDDAGKVAKRVASGPVSVDYLVQDGIPKFVEMLLDKYRLDPVPEATTL